MTDTTASPFKQDLPPGPTYENLTLWMPQMISHALRSGQALIKGQTFINCRIEGPALMLPLACNFDGCDMGYAGGDVTNLFVRPIGPKVIGAIAFQDCNFLNCRFYAVGFTGDEAFLDSFIAMLGVPSPS